MDRAQALETRDRDGALATLRAGQVAAGRRWAGDCVECLDPIEPERKAVSPGARRCLVCQEQLERRQRLFAKGA